MYLHTEEPEVRIDRRGREYHYIRAVDPTDNFRSATVFANPAGTTTAVYVWWQNRQWNEVTGATVRRTWCDRYLYLHDRGVVVKTKKGKRMPDKMMGGLADLLMAWELVPRLVMASEPSMSALADQLTLAVDPFGLPEGWPFTHPFEPDPWDQPLPGRHLHVVPDPQEDEEPF